MRQRRLLPSERGIKLTREAITGSRVAVSTQERAGRKGWLLEVRVGN